MFQKEPDVLDIFKRYKQELGDFTDYTNTLNSLLIPSLNKDKRIKKVFQYDTDGTYLGEYESMADAERANNIYSGKVRESVKGRQLTVGGFFWSDHQLTTEEIAQKVSRIKNSRYSKLKNKGLKLNQYSLEGEFVKSWNTMTEAARELNISVSGISLCCSGRYKQAYGYIWKIE